MVTRTTAERNSIGRFGICFPRFLHSVDEVPHESLACSWLEPGLPGPHQKVCYRSDRQETVHGLDDDTVYQPLFIGEQWLPLCWNQIVLICHCCHPLPLCFVAGLPRALSCTPESTHSRCQELFAGLAWLYVCRIHPVNTEILHIYSLFAMQMVYMACFFSFL